MTGPTDERPFHEFFFKTHQRDVFDGLDDFLEYLEDTREREEYWYRRTLCQGSGPTTRVRDPSSGESREMILMASNNYLDLATDPLVVQAAAEGLRKLGAGSGSVSLLAGTHAIHLELEEALAAFYHRDEAVVFPSGYSANVGCMGALAREGDLLLLDMYAHASIVDGTHMGGAKVKFFKHNDMDHLRDLLDRTRERFNGVLIATDGVFSMDGDVCNLPELARIRDDYDARLMVDEAHAIGMLGRTGRGTEEYFDLMGSVDLLVGTLSKAPAGIGGYAVGTKALSEYLRHFSNSYIFSTSLPPSVVAGLIEALRIISTDGARTESLRRNAEYFISEVRSAGFRVGGTVTAIVPVIIGDERITRLMARDLDREGIFVSPVVFPAVAKTQSRLRFSLMATHTRAHLDKAVDALRRLGAEHGILER